MPIYKPPSNISKRDRKLKSIFLAGSIEMGKAEDWQSRIEKIFELSYNVFNPRRDDWDASWIQEFDNPQFSQQVRWELNAMEEADTILYNLVPNTISPITLLEIGLHAKDTTKDIYVICPKGYWRKGNIDIVCEWYDIPLFDSIDEFINSK